MPVAIAGDSTMAVTVYEARCCSFVRCARSGGDDRVLRIAFAEGREPLFPLPWALWLAFGVQQHTSIS